MLLSEVLIRWVILSVIGAILYEIFIGKSEVKKTIIWIIANVIFIPFMVLGQLNLWRSYYKNKNTLKISYSYAALEFVSVLALQYCVFLRLNIWELLFAIIYVLLNCGLVFYSLSRYDLFIKVGYLLNIIALAYISTHLP